MTDLRRKEGLSDAIANYGDDNRALLTDLYRRLLRDISKPFIIDSKKGVKLEKTWIRKNREADETEAGVGRSDFTDVAKLASWINTQCNGEPRSAEGYYVHWSQVHTANRHMTNIAAMMTGAILRERAMQGLEKTKVIDTLFLEMVKINPKITRAAASVSSNGITKFYGLILQCGEDAVFSNILSARHLRNKTESEYRICLEENAELGNERMETFMGLLTLESSFKDILVDTLAKIRIDRATRSNWRARITPTQEGGTDKVVASIPVALPLVRSQRSNIRRFGLEPPTTRSAKSMN